MKKLFVFLGTGLLAANLFATGYPVFDVSGWLNGIDQLYQQYDMVMNGIESIQNQYEQIQSAIEAAKGIDWNNIKFDGDFDIRNDIKSATKRVNKLLSCTRMAKEALTKPSINVGGVNCSIADLCGAGTDGKDMFNMAQHALNYMTANAKQAVDGIVDGLDEKQRRAIWLKYGISPRNYSMVFMANQALKEKCGKTISEASKEMLEAHAEMKSTEINTVLSAAYAAKDKNGNMPEGANQEAMLQLSAMVNENLISLEQAVKVATANNMQKQVADLQAQEAKLKEQEEETERERKDQNKLPNGFLYGM